MARKRNPPSAGAQGRTVWKAMRTKKRFTIKQAAKATGMSEMKARTGIEWLSRYGYVQPMGESYTPSRGSFRVNPDKPPPASWKFKGPVLSKDHPGAGFRHYGEAAKPKKKAKAKRKPRGRTVLQSSKAGHQTVGYINDDGFFVAASEIEEIDPGVPNPSSAPTGRDKEIWGAAEGLIHDVETQKYRAKMEAALKRYKQQGNPNADAVVRKFTLHILTDSKYSLEKSAKKATGPGAKEARAILKKISKGIANEEPRSHLDKYATIASKMERDAIKRKRGSIIYNITSGASSAAVSYIWGYIPENMSELVGLIIAGDNASVKAGHPFPMALIDYTNALTKFMREAERSGGRLRVVGNPKKKAKKKAKKKGTLSSPARKILDELNYAFRGIEKLTRHEYLWTSDVGRSPKVRSPKKAMDELVSKKYAKYTQDGEAIRLTASGRKEAGGMIEVSPEEAARAKAWWKEQLFPTKKASKKKAQKEEPLVTQDEFDMADAYLRMKKFGGTLEEHGRALEAERAAKKKAKKKTKKNPPKSKTKKVPWSSRDIKGMQEFADRKTGSKRKATKKKVARKKTPPYQLLINRCQKLWTSYCDRPSKRRLEALYVHLDKMKESTSKKVATERSRCMRAANAEAKKLKYTRKK